MANEYVPKAGDTLLVEVEIITYTGEEYICAIRSGAFCNPPADVHVGKETARLGKRQLRAGDLVRYSANPDGDEEQQQHYWRGRLIAWDDRAGTWLIRDNTSSFTGGSLSERKPHHVWHD